MILNWKKDCIKIIDTPSKKGKMILPGINEMSESDWDAVKGSLANEIKHGLLEEVKAVTQSAPGKPSKPAKSVLDLDSKKAKAFIKETNNGETLNGWLSKENRPDVRRYIEDRLTELGLDKEDIEDTSSIDDVKDDKAPKE